MTEEEKVKISGALTVLKPFVEATEDISGDKYVSISLIVPLAKLIMQQCTQERQSKNLACILSAQLLHCFASIESAYVTAVATLLDPRFKKIPFSNTSAVEQSIRRLTVEMKDLEPQTIETNSTDLFEPREGPSSKETHSLWESFDKKIMEASSRRTSTTDAFIEVRRYFEEINIDRKEDPLTWWKVNQSRFPKLQMIAKKYLCIPGSSVPSERLFSKAGELVSEKRNRIKPKNIDMMLFLNNNLTYTVLHRLLSIIIYTLR